MWQSGVGLFLQGTGVAVQAAGVGVQIADLQRKLNKIPVTSPGTQAPQ